MRLRAKAAENPASARLATTITANPSKPRFAPSPVLRRGNVQVTIQSGDPQMPMSQFELIFGDPCANLHPAATRVTLSPAAKGLTCVPGGEVTAAQRIKSARNS
jgi:hypothetical protein